MKFEKETLLFGEANRQMQLTRSSSGWCDMKPTWKTGTSNRLRERLQSSSLIPVTFTLAEAH